MDDDGQEFTIPQRLADPVRWLVTEAAGRVTDAHCNYKVVINLGRGEAPPKTVIERHEILRS